MVKRALLLTVFLSPLAVAQPRDYWLKTERRGTGYAYEHVVVTRRPDGNLQYEAQSHAKTDVAEMNPQDLEYREICIVDGELRPISFESTTKTPAKEQHASGVRAGKQMNVTIWDRGEPEQKRAIDINDAYFDIVANDLIVRRAAEKKFSLRLFGAFDSKAATRQVEILETGSGGIVALVKGDALTTRCRIALDGRLLEATILELAGHRTYSTDASDARNIGYLHTADGLSLMVTSRKSFPNVYQVMRAQVRVRWKQIPFEEFRLQDNRQKIVSKTQSGGQYEVVVETGMPAKPRNAAAPAPAEISKKYLGEDDFIKPREEAIRKQAAKIAGGFKDRAELVNRLLAWVNTNIQADPIAETLTGPDVLAKRRGKCSEYAILFASLARAEGIPTRVVLGVKGNGRWVGHMWDEVWLGEWMAVDATEGVFAGTALVKFIDSDTVEGILGVRLKLVDNLEIEILNFEEAGARTALKTGLSGLTYTNASYGCRISAPDDTWTLKEGTDGGSAMVTMKKGGAEFALVFFGVPPGTEATKTLESRLAAISKMKIVPNYQFLAKGSTDIASRHNAPSAIFSQTDEVGNTRINENILLIDGASAYLFAWIAPQEQFDTLHTTLDKILGSFELVKGPASARP
jgi:hypothetical protein